MKVREHGGSILRSLEASCQPAPPSRLQLREKHQGTRLAHAPLCKSRPLSRAGPSRCWPICHVFHTCFHLHLLLPTDSVPRLPKITQLHYICQDRFWREFWKLLSTLHCSINTVVETAVYYLSSFSKSVSFNFVMPFYYTFMA